LIRQVASHLLYHQTGYNSVADATIEMFVIGTIPWYCSISSCRYRAMFKYLPQNDDELELLEGDTVYVLEKCDDGWYVGSSDRTGAFGTFPGNYVEKI
jgi:hypothetical protein